MFNKIGVSRCHLPSIKDKKAQMQLLFQLHAFNVTVDIPFSFIIFLSLPPLIPSWEFSMLNPFLATKALITVSATVCQRAALWV